MARTSIAIVAGRGIDRASGALAQDQASWYRIINAWLREGKLIARGGLTVSTFAPGEDPPPPEVAFQITFQDTFVDADGTDLVDHVPTPGGLETWEIAGPLSQYGINAYNTAAETVYDGNLNLAPARATYVTPLLPSKFRVWGDFWRTGSDFLGFGAGLYCYINAGAQTETGGVPVPPQLYNALALTMRRSSANQFDTEVTYYDGAGVATSLSDPLLVTIVQGLDTGLRYILEVDEVAGTIAFYTADYLTGAAETLIEAGIPLPAPLLAKAAIDRHVGFLSNLATAAALWMDNFAVEVLTTIIAPGSFVPYTDVIGIYSFRANRGGVLVTYDRASRKLAIWTVDGAGQTPVFVGEWATLPAGAPLPLASACEAAGKMFFAHSEPLFNYRAKTIYFDPSLSPGAQLVDLMANLDTTVPKAIRYRDVKTWLGAVWGTGYGTGSDENAPEILRNSDQGDVLVVRGESYFQAGAADDAIVGLMIEGGVLKALKGAQKYKVTGEDPTTFGILLEEETYGLVGDRLTIELGTEAIAWSEQGPRLHDGAGPSIDIGISLDLDGVEPENIVPAGDERYGWMVYAPNERAVIIGFPDLESGTKTRCYVLSRRDPGQMRWSYFELQQLVYSAGLLVAGAPSVGLVPTGFASNVVIADNGAVGTGRSGALTFDANAMIGGETWQVFAKPTGGLWTMLYSFAATGGSEAVTVPGFDALRHYEIAVRAIKTGNATLGFSNADPDLWTAVEAPGAKTAFDTSCAAPIITAIAWTRIAAGSHKITLHVTLPALGVGFELERSPDGVGTWTSAESYAAPDDLRLIDHAIADVDLATRIWWRIRAKRGALESANSAVVSRWIGPTIIPGFFAAQRTITQDFDMWIRTVDGVGKLQVQTSPDGATAWVTNFFSAVLAQPQNVPSSIALGSVSFIRARWAVTTFGIDDFGEWSPTDSFRLTNGAVPATPAAFTGSIYTAPNHIEVDFASVAPSFRLLRYTDQADPGAIVFLAALLAADTAIIIPDLYHIPAVNYEGYKQFALGAPPPVGLTSYSLNVAGGLRKISLPRAELVPIITAGAATNLVLSQPGGVGTLNVAWDNNMVPQAQTTIVWGVGPAGGMDFLAPDVAVAGPNDSVDGPSGGLALPASGTTIKVRIYVSRYIGGPIGRTAVTEANIVLA